MALGDDIRSVFEEIGSKIDVYVYAEDTSITEYIDTEYEVNQIYPHTSHYAMKGFFPYDTQAAPGSLISFTDTADIDRYLLMSLTKERFGGEDITKEGVLYKCNAVAEIRRKAFTRNSNMEQVVTWPIQNSGEYVFFTGQMDTMVTDKKDFGWTVLDRNLLYISAAVDLRLEDRCVIKNSMDEVSGEAYEVELIEEQRLPGIKICRVIEDTRK